MVGANEVDFREHSFTMQRGGKVLDVWNGVTIWSSETVESTIITTGAPVTRSWFRNHMKGQGPIAGGRPDDTQLKHMVKFSFSNL